METYTLFILLFAVLTLVLALIFVRRYTQRTQASLSDENFDVETLNQIELIRVQNPSRQDLQAYTLIETERRKIWQHFSTETSLSPRKILHSSLELIHRIAAIYYPEREHPEFQVALADMIDFNERILLRLKEHLEDFPLNTITNVQVEDILKYKQYYETFSQFQLIQVAQKNQYLYTLGRYAWMGYNALNPWYWGRKVIMTAGKESAFRYLLTVILTIVGEEAVLVYSKRQIRTYAAALEKQIAFEMINMAVVDDVVSQEEYDIILNFVLNNPRLSESVKITLIKALHHKRPIKTEGMSEKYELKEKKRLLAEVERVAKADNLGILKKREALKTLEAALELTSEYRAQLEIAPHEEVHTRDVMQQQRCREEAILRLMVQAGALHEPFPDSLREYIIQRAASYPLPFHEEEQARILRECLVPGSLDALTNQIQSQVEKERALSEILDALLWYLPFTRRKEEFYTQLLLSLDLKKSRSKFLARRLQRLLPQGKLIDTPPPEILTGLFRLLTQKEQILALQETATAYQFITIGEKPRKKEAYFWLCVTTMRVLTLTATMIERIQYHHHLEFQHDLEATIERGRVSDTYILHDATQELRLQSALFRSTNLEKALTRYLPPHEKQE